MVDDAQFDGFVVGVPQVFQRVGPGGGIPRETIKVPQVESNQLSALVQVPHDLEIRRAMPIQTVVIDVVVRQHLRPGELVLLPGIDGILGGVAILARERLLFVRRVVVRGERDRHGQGAVLRQGERAHADGQRECLRHDAFRRNAKRATINARRLVLGRTDPDPKALQVTSRDVHRAEEVKDRVGPPTNVRCAIGRAGLGLDIAHDLAVNLLAREHRTGGGFQVADAHRDLL